MSKKFLIALACASPLFAAEPAKAFDVRDTYSVSFDGERVGTWRFRSRVEETFDSCIYTIMWSNLSGPPLTRTVLCKIEEAKASDNFDCEENRRTSFSTIVQRYRSCSGFDDFGSQTSIRTLIGGETSRDSINGVVSTASIGDVQTFEVD